MTILKRLKEQPPNIEVSKITKEISEVEQKIQDTSIEDETELKRLMSERDKFMLKLGAAANDSEIVKNFDARRKEINDRMPEQGSVSRSRKNTTGLTGLRTNYFER